MFPHFSGGFSSHDKPESYWLDEWTDERKNLKQSKSTFTLSCNFTYRPTCLSASASTFFDSILPPALDVWWRWSRLRCAVKLEVLPWLRLNDFLHSLYIAIGLIRFIGLRFRPAQRASTKYSTGVWTAALLNLQTCFVSGMAADYVRQSHYCSQPHIDAARVM